MMKKPYFYSKSILMFKLQIRHVEAIKQFIDYLNENKF